MTAYSGKQQIRVLVADVERDPDRDAGEGRERQHPGMPQQQPGACGRGDEATGRRHEQRPGAPVRREVGAEHAQAHRPGDETGEPELAARRHEQERETDTAERAGETGELGQRTGSRTKTAARAVCPFAETVNVKRPFCSGARSRSVPGRAKPLRPPSVHRTRGASEETRTANGAPAAAVIRLRPSVTKRTAIGIAGVRGRPVAGRIEGQQLDRVDARPNGSSTHLPVPDDRLLRAWKPRQRAPLAVDEEHAAAVLAQPVADGQLVRAPVPVGRDDAGLHRHVLEHGRRHVDPDRVRQRDRLVLATDVDARPVLALRQDAARVVAAVPADHDRPLRIALPPLDRPHDLAAVDDCDVELVGVAELERDPRLVLGALADGREDRLHPRPEDRALLQLQSLGERERRSGGREQGDHQHRRGDTSHWRRILVFAA